MSESARVWCALFAMTMIPLASASAQTAKLSWDHDPGAGALGYAVTLDGIKTDYGLAPLAGGNVCGCSVQLPVAGGKHTIVVTAYNQFGESDSAPLVVAPSAVAGGPYLGEPGVPLTLNASGSSAPTGFIAEYHWHWADGTPDTVTSTPTASHTFNAAGVFTVTLTIADNTGATASTTAVVGLAALGSPSPLPGDGHQGAPPPPASGTHSGTP